MNLFTLCAKLTLDANAYEQGIKKAQSAAQGAVQVVQALGGAVRSSLKATLSATETAVGALDGVQSGVQKIEDSTRKATRNGRSLWSRFFSGIQSEGASALSAISLMTLDMTGVIARGAAQGLGEMGRLAASAVRMSAALGAAKAGAATAGTGRAAGFATGLDYVPYDEYPALLHQGEAVLTRAEARGWRKGEGGAYSWVDYAYLGSVVGEAVRAALAGMSVEIDGQRAGRILSAPVSRNIAQAAKNRRYQTV